MTLWQCCPSPFCNIPKKPLTEKRTSTVTHLLLKKEPQRQRRLRAEEQGGQLKNEWWNLGTELWETKLGRFTSLGFDLASKNRFWHPVIEFAIVKSIWNRFCHCKIDFSHHQCTLKLDLFNWRHPQIFPNSVAKHKHLDNNFKQHPGRFLLCNYSLETNHC